MLSVVFDLFLGRMFFTKCRYAECRYAECRGVYPILMPATLTLSL
jgi:hypothetical protein